MIDKQEFVKNYTKNLLNLVYEFMSIPGFNVTRTMDGCFMLTHDQDWYEETIFQPTIDRYSEDVDSDIFDAEQAIIRYRDMVKREKAEAQNLCSE
jgi:hypothetical protein